MRRFPGGQVVPPDGEEVRCVEARSRRRHSGFHRLFAGEEWTLHPAIGLVTAEQNS